MNKLDLAIEFAARAHGEQKRKGTDIPYISHPFAVGMILQQEKCKEDVVVAGILHDTLEDTETAEDDIRSLFGEKVLALVIGASEPDKSLSWKERKEHTLEFLKTATLDMRYVSCADKLHNLRSIRRDMEHVGDTVWNKFKRGYEDQKWYYTNLVESLGYASRFPLLDTYQEEIEEMFMKRELSEERKALRTNKKFFDAVFESLFCLPDREKQLREELIAMKATEELTAFANLLEDSRSGSSQSEEKKQELYSYFTSRGLEFETNSEGTDILISACAALQELFHLYPHEIYHHLMRNVKRGVL